MVSKYVIGIDLGTTNSVLAWSSLQSDTPSVHVLAIPQLVAPNTVETRSMLPSFLYLPTADEAKSGSLKLDHTSGDYATGTLARTLSAEFPDRTVGAAKSWLCHSRVDRRQPILPWQAPESVPKVSPVTASQLYLEHLVAAWQKEFPTAPFAEQVVVLTVPASFDASARELTREAALAAGFDEAQGSVIISLDGDLQHAPEDIPALLEKIEEGYDIASGWRKQRLDNAVTRKIPSRIANWLMAKASGVDLRDFGTTFKAYRAEILKDVNLYGELHRFIPALASFYGARIAIDGNLRPGSEAVLTVVDGALALRPAS